MPDTTRPKATRIPVDRIAQSAAVLILALCLLLTVASEFERVWWRFYQIAQFRVELFVLSVLLTACFLPKQRTKTLAVGAVICTILNFTHLMPYYLPLLQKEARSDKTLKLMQMNLNVKNKSYSEVAAYIRKVNADAVLIEELTPEWQQYFGAHLPEYPHVILGPPIDTCGIGVYSKTPLKDGRVVLIGTSKYASIIGELSGLELPITLFHTHVQGPVKEHFFERHKEQFEAMTAKIYQLRQPLVFCGDMNSTPWSYLISDLVANTRLRDARWGRGINLTWPTPFYWRYGFCPLLAIDHYFLSSDLVVRKIQLGKAISSDHYPLIIELSLDKRAR